MKANLYIKSISTIFITLGFLACNLHRKKSQDDQSLDIRNDICSPLNPKHYKVPRKLKYGLFDDLLILKGDEGKQENYHSKYYVKEYDVNFDLLMTHKFYKIIKPNTVSRGYQHSGKLKKIKLLFPQELMVGPRANNLSELEDHYVECISLCLQFESQNGDIIDIVFRAIRDDIKAFAKSLEEGAEDIKQKFSIELFINKKSASDKGYYFYQTKVHDDSQDFINNESSYQSSDEILRLTNKTGIEKLKKIVNKLSSLEHLRKFITSKHFCEKEIKID
ncbi:hypothetical protein bcCo53_001230 (plasmid) [Borrelia coriaceae]|uniref:Lipoprotein n=1 Tax=Borrelia coriaceae ATCC 43381 TaxID=1408429 RepID=W5SWI9_9SPIR|nr:hypothetical protein [Borrelia coriaceae]AHH11058.1 hypothetical protein BCO_0900019 [Borrelia coriaceae ATCC 43381]UPA17061.1 hypothetical protein bcCo53_001230 [Borrelia coriaceae]